MTKVNPFTPNSPAHSGMFIGRIFEVDRIEKALVQTKHSNPTHLLLLGERGIGKTSLLNVAEMFARGEFQWGDYKHNFLAVRLSLHDGMELVDFAIALKKAIEREINKDNPELALFKNAWKFLSRFEGAGFSYRKEESRAGATQLIQEFIYSLIDLVKSIKDPSIMEKKDGLVILLDEADKASQGLRLGEFLKSLSEALISENCNSVLFILTGLPNVTDVLLNSHQSSLRLFEELNLNPLSKEETALVIQRGLNTVLEKSGQEIVVDPEAYEGIYFYSEGYPHFVQQIGYSVFEIDRDNKITKEDVQRGFLDDHGALEKIGDRYYSKLFYKDINTQSQRDILEIMSEKWNDFVSREEIKKKFSGKETSLNNGIRALIEKGTIIPKDGSKGKYRLQWVSFALWIKNHNRAKHRN